MKKFRWIYLAILTLCLSLTISLTACADELCRNRMLEYYSDDSNYVELTGVVLEKVKNGNRLTNILSIRVISSDDDFYMYGSDTGYFCVYSQKLLDSINVDDNIIFESAPRIFYDGQEYPILSLNKDGQELLSFAEGKNTFIEWIKNDFN